jgi:hypothetical protein
MQLILGNVSIFKLGPLPESGSSAVTAWFGMSQFTALTPSNNPNNPTFCEVTINGLLPA